MTCRLHIPRNFNLIFSSTVAKSLSLSSIVVLALVTVSTIKLVKSECCRVKYGMQHVCLGNEYEKRIPMNEPIGIAVMQRSGSKYWIRNPNDRSRPKCSTSFCEDGSHAKNGSCGVRKCIIFGM